MSPAKTGTPASGLTSGAFASCAAATPAPRKRWAVLRTIGLSVLGVVVIYSAFAVYLGITTVAAGVIRAETGVVLQPLAWHSILAWAPAAMIGLSALAGVVPAIKAYRTNIAENLVPVS